MAWSRWAWSSARGRSALAYRFQKLGFQFNRNDVDVLYSDFLQVADSKKEVEDKDLAVMAKKYQSTLVAVN